MVGWVVSLNGNKASLSLSCTWNLAELSIFIALLIYLLAKDLKIYYILTLKEGGAIGPSRIQKAIYLELNVGLTSNEALNSNFYVV